MKNEKIKKMLKDKKMLIIIGVVLLLIILLIIFITKNNDNLNPNNNPNNNSNGNNNTSENDLYDKNGNIIIPKDYVATNEECFEFADGAITGYYCYEGNMYGYEAVTDLVIPYTIDGEVVKEIGKKSFSADDNKKIKIKKVTLPNSIIKVGERAFYYNPLESIVLSNNLETIGNRAFYVGNYENNDFYKYKQDHLIIPDSVKTLGGGSFHGYKIKELTISAEDIGNFESGTGDFIGCKISKLNLKEGVKYIRYGSFEFNLIEEVNIPDSVINIEENAFTGNKLKTIKLGKNVIEIKENAFGKGKADTSSSNGEDWYNYHNYELSKIYLATKEQRQFNWEEIVGKDYYSTVTYELPKSE